MHCEMLVSTCQQTWRFSCFFVFSKRAGANLFCIIGISLSSLRKTKLHIKIWGFQFFYLMSYYYLTTRNRGHKDVKLAFFQRAYLHVYKTSKGTVPVLYRSSCVTVNSATSASQNSVCIYISALLNICVIRDGIDKIFHFIVLSLKTIYDNKLI